MFTLIKREIVDTIALFLVAGIIASMFIVLMCESGLVHSSYPTIGVPEVMYRNFHLFIAFEAVLAFGAGAGQMNGDRNEKISMFLSTLATTRQQILGAKMIVGLLLILVMIVPVAIADIILLRLIPRLIPLDTSVLVRLFVTGFSAFACCYSIGLQMGWKTNKLVAFVGSFCVSAILISIVVIKGYGVDAVVLLLLMTTALLVRTWQRFLSTPL